MYLFIDDPMMDIHYFSQYSYPDFQTFNLLDYFLSNNFLTPIIFDPIDFDFNFLWNLFFDFMIYFFTNF